jgi:hypothetical protein
MSDCGENGMDVDDSDDGGFQSDTYDTPDHNRRDKTATPDADIEAGNAMASSSIYREIDCIRPNSDDIQNANGLPAPRLPEWASCPEVPIPERNIDWPKVQQCIVTMRDARAQLEGERNTGTANRMARVRALVTNAEASHGAQVRNAIRDAVYSSRLAWNTILEHAPADADVLRDIRDGKSLLSLAFLGARMDIDVSHLNLATNLTATAFRMRIRKKDEPFGQLFSVLSGKPACTNLVAEVLRDAIASAHDTRSAKEELAQALFRLYLGDTTDVICCAIARANLPDESPLDVPWNWVRHILGSNGLALLRPYTRLVWPTVEPSWEMVKDERAKLRARIERVFGTMPKHVEAILDGDGWTFLRDALPTSELREKASELLLSSTNVHASLCALDVPQDKRELECPCDREAAQWFVRHVVVPAAHNRLSDGARTDSAPLVAAALRAARTPIQFLRFMHSSANLAHTVKSWDTAIVKVVDPLEAKDVDDAFMNYLRSMNAQEMPRQRMRERDLKAYAGIKPVLQYVARMQQSPLQYDWVRRTIGLVGISHSEAASCITYKDGKLKMDTASKAESGTWLTQLALELAARREGEGEGEPEDMCCVFASPSHLSDTAFPGCTEWYLPILKGDTSSLDIVLNCASDLALTLGDHKRYNLPEQFDRLKKRSLSDAVVVGADGTIASGKLKVAQDFDDNDIITVGHVQLGTGWVGGVMVGHSPDDFTASIIRVRGLAGNPLRLQITDTPIDHGRGVALAPVPSSSSVVNEMFGVYAWFSETETWRRLFIRKGNVTNDSPYNGIANLENPLDLRTATLQNGADPELRRRLYQFERGRAGARSTQQPSSSAPIISEFLKTQRVKSPPFRLDVRMRGPIPAEMIAKLKETRPFIAPNHPSARVIAMLEGWSDEAMAFEVEARGAIMTNPKFDEQLTAIGIPPYSCDRKWRNGAITAYAELYATRPSDDILDHVMLPERFEKQMLAYHGPKRRSWLFRHVARHAPREWNSPYLNIHARMKAWIDMLDKARKRNVSMVGCLGLGYLRAIAANHVHSATADRRTWAYLPASVQLERELAARLGPEITTRASQPFCRARLWASMTIPGDPVLGGAFQKRIKDRLAKYGMQYPFPDLVFDATKRRIAAEVQAFNKSLRAAAFVHYTVKPISPRPKGQYPPVVRPPINTIVLGASVVDINGMTLANGMIISVFRMAPAAKGAPANSNRVHLPAVLLEASSDGTVVRVRFIGIPSMWEHDIVASSSVSGFFGLPPHVERTSSADDFVWWYRAPSPGAPAIIKRSGSASNRHLAAWKALRSTHISERWRVAAVLVNSRVALLGQPEMFKNTDIKGLAIGLFGKSVATTKVYAEFEKMVVAGSNCTQHQHDKVITMHMMFSNQPTNKQKYNDGGRLRAVSAARCVTAPVISRVTDELRVCDCGPCTQNYIVPEGMSADNAAKRIATAMRLARDFRGASWPNAEFLKLALDADKRMNRQA